MQQSLIILFSHFSALLVLYSYKDAHALPVPPPVVPSISVFNPYIHNNNYSTNEPSLHMQRDEHIGDSDKFEGSGNGPPKNYDKHNRMKFDDTEDGDDDEDDEDYDYKDPTDNGSGQNHNDKTSKKLEPTGNVNNSQMKTPINSDLYYPFKPSVYPAKDNVTTMPVLINIKPTKPPSLPTKPPLVIIASSTTTTPRTPPSSDITKIKPNSTKSDIDYDYEDEAEDDDSEDTSVFEDGEPINGPPVTLNKTSTTSHTTPSQVTTTVPTTIRPRPVSTPTTTSVDVHTDEDDDAEDEEIEEEDEEEEEDHGVDLDDIDGGASVTSSVSSASSTTSPTPQRLNPTIAPATTIIPKTIPTSPPSTTPPIYFTTPTTSGPPFQTIIVGPTTPRYHQISPTRANINHQGSPKPPDTFIDESLTRQLYDKVVEVYHETNKTVRAAIDAVWPENFEFSQASFEPLLARPMFFMLGLAGVVICIVLLMMLVVYIITCQIQPKYDEDDDDDISIY